MEHRWPMKKEKQGTKFTESLGRNTSLEDLDLIPVSLSHATVKKPICLSGETCL